jgi:hypothetical protein
MNAAAQNKRKERDLMKLMMSNYEVNLADENNPNDLYVIFQGPKDSPYEGVRIYKDIKYIGNMESPRFNTRPVSIQISLHRIF